MSKIIVLAGSFEQFRNWVLEIDSKDRGDFIYASVPNDMRGVKISHVLRIGTYYNNPSWHELYAFAKELSERP